LPRRKEEVPHKKAD